MIHQLKIKSNYFEDILSGNKTFEVRENDRNYYVGEFLALNELTSHPVNDKGEHKETGRCCLMEIVYILNDSDYCKDGQVVLGIKPCRIHRHDGFDLNDYTTCNVPVYNSIDRSVGNDT